MPALPAEGLQTVTAIDYDSGYLRPDQASHERAKASHERARPLLSELPERLPPGEYRMLSLRQPWAWVVVFGGKDIENRSWKTDYRGDILIHASKTMTRSEYRRVHDFALLHGVSIPNASALDFGGIIGRATLVDILQPTAVDARGERRRWHLPPDSPFVKKPQYGWVLERARPVEFVPCLGALNLMKYVHEEAA